MENESWPIPSISASEKLARSASLIATSIDSRERLKRDRLLSLSLSLRQTNSLLDRLEGTDVFPTHRPIPSALNLRFVRKFDTLELQLRPGDIAGRPSVSLFERANMLGDSKSVN